MRERQRGFVLITLVALLVMGALGFLAYNLSPEFMQAYRQRQTEAALNEAREALLGYALRYRDDQAAQDTNADGDDDRAMYGYLPMPDMGEVFSQNGSLTNPPCVGEGCATLNQNPINPAYTYIGRFPWRTVGTGPLKDGNGECLWYVISSTHRQPDQDQTQPMNWDTLSQMEIVTTTSPESARLQIRNASAHDRPIAIIFSPGPPLPGQNRATINDGNDVTACGGNYLPANYLEPMLAATLLDHAGNADAGLTYFPGGTSFDTSTQRLAFAAEGRLLKDGGGVLRKSCPTDPTTCVEVGNDLGLPITSSTLFDAISKHNYFRADINGMLTKLADCMNQQIYAWDHAVPPAPTIRAFDFAPLLDQSGNPLTAPVGISVGRMNPLSSCFTDDDDPKGYVNHYRDQIFLAGCASGNCLTAKIRQADGTTQTQTCAAVVIFAGQRAAGQQRTTTTEIFVDDAGGNHTVQQRNNPANYLEGSNLDAFKTTDTNFFEGFTGDDQFHSGLYSQLPVTYTQLPNQDIVRCVTGAPVVNNVASPNLTLDQQLVTYDATTGNLILGKANVTSATVAVADLFGCAWMNGIDAIGSGFRTYFTFNFSVIGNTGFTFAAIDTDSNSALPCGMAGSHLGYSGNNGLTAKLAYPKLGIEFDQSRNSGFPTTLSGQQSTNAGRNDPCYTCGSGTADSHAAIVYWGHEAANVIDGVILPDNDDNVHGFPTDDSLSTLRRPPKNPATAPGIMPMPKMRQANTLFHVRVEVTPTRTTDANIAENSKTMLQIKVWILPDSATTANQIAAMKNTTRPMSQLYPGFIETLSDTPAIFDVASGASCSRNPPVVACPTDQACGSDNLCYRQGMKNLRLGFTGSQRTQAQQVMISNFFTTWLP
jgi:type II secretory pathway pseudopilin PulG